MNVLRDHALIIQLLTSGEEFLIWVSDFQMQSASKPEKVPRRYFYEFGFFGGKSQCFWSCMDEHTMWSYRTGYAGLHKRTEWWELLDFRREKRVKGAAAASVSILWYGSCFFFGISRLSVYENLLVMVSLWVMLNAQITQRGTVIVHLRENSDSVWSRRPNWKNCCLRRLIRSIRSF